MGRKSVQLSCFQRANIERENKERRGGGKEELEEGALLSSHDELQEGRGEAHKGGIRSEAFVSSGCIVGGIRGAEDGRWRGTEEERDSEEDS